MWTIITTATIAGALIGLGLTRNLATLHYRRPEETSLPKPTQTWWLIPALAATWGTLTWRHADDAWPILALWLPLTAALGWLSAVDLDVRRLPDKILLPSAVWMVIILIADAIHAGSPRPVSIAASMGIVAGLGAWVVHVASRGAIGFGDVKLVAFLSASLAFINPTLVFPACLSACLMAIVVAIATRQRQTPFGPWLALAFVAALGS